MPSLPPLSERTMSRAFARALDEVPDKTAFIEHDGREWTYAATQRRALNIAGGLAQEGVDEQQTVALMLDNSFDFLAAAFGLGLTRRVQVPVNTAYKGEFLAHQLRDSGVTVAIVEDQYAGRVAAVADSVPELSVVVVRGGDGESLRGTRLKVVPFEALIDAQPAAAVAAAPGDLMAIMYTSGTTGVSKGVEISHAHAYTYSSREDAQRPNSDDRILVVLPLFHLAGQWYGAYQSVIARATAVIQPGFSVSRYWDWVREFQITETVMLGAVAELLQQAEPQPDDADNSLSLAVMAPLASNLDDFRRRFGIDVGAVYGMSEIGGVMFSEPGEVVAGEAGLAREGFELRLVDEDGKDVEVGAAGELLVRPEFSELIMTGYHGLSEKTAEAIIDGWMHTGDIFKQDAEGHFYFVDRRKDALRRRGENVSSFEVERVLNEYPDVLESAVVAVPAEIGEDEIKAVVVAREGRSIEPEGLIRFVAERLPYFMVPRFVEIAEELPKTPTHKIQKNKLRESGADAVWDREKAGIVVNRNT